MRHLGVCALAASCAGAQALQGGAHDPRASRPPLQYTAPFQDRWRQPVTLTPIGWISSPYKERFGTPRQPTVTRQVAGRRAQEGTIELAADVGLRHSLRSLEGFDYCWVICYMHMNTGWRPLVTPPRGPRKMRRGVFATRAPHRPNQLALSALRIREVQAEELRIKVTGLDLLDGTPVLDIKPYIPYADAFPNAAAGWVDELGSPHAPDHLDYFPPPPHLESSE
ncbi:hypothetical protein AB1Y20_014956 [Prymnesium parvum]|uniref:TsaA-like domain-containing protein n=1 Tax=Prymnesium parvum TaxID=97485 RepID=A0AB34JWZ5_PRYPA